MQGMTTDHQGKLLPIKHPIRLPNTTESTTLHYIKTEPANFQSERKSVPPVIVSNVDLEAEPLKPGQWFSQVRRDDHTGSEASMGEQVWQTSSSNFLNKLKVRRLVEKQT